MDLKNVTRRSLSLTLCATVALANISFLANAQVMGEKQGGAVKVVKDENKITISNDFIKREFSITNGKVGTTEIENKRANTTLIPQVGSEDFVINTIGNSEESKPEVTVPVDVLDRTNWAATLTAKNGSYDQTQVGKLFDDDANTHVDRHQVNGHPISLKIDLGEEKTVSSFSYLKRPGYADATYGKNGTMGKYALYVSENGVDWQEAGTGEFTKEDHNLHQEGDLHNVGDVVYANFDDTYTTRYVRIDQLSDALGGTQEFSGSEINLFVDKYQVAEVETEETAIKSSDLSIDNSQTKVENIENGKKITIAYEPYQFNGIEYDIDMVTILENDDHYMRSFLEIKTNEDKTKIDYIDLDRFVLPSDVQDTVWSHPDLQDVSSQWIGKNELMLGQPIYANGMFFGSEFPASDTDVVNDQMQIRYYSGKSFEQLKADNQLTVDGKFVSWQNVVGAAKGVDTDVVQTDFFEYISEIATPTAFRKQYNSWYDNMLGISDESIAKSFYGSEKGLTQNGVEPVDSYVVDDGWNNYRDEQYNPNISVADSGTSINRTGFWEFNDKFPNELYTSASLSNKLQSKFGLWLGPQGGYNYFGGFGQYLEKMGTGYLQKDYWNNVCVGSDKYIKNLTNLFTDYQSRFDIDYWKLDGFAVRPCTDSDHDHMTGGTNNMYYTTDLWEKWTDAWEAMRENRAQEGKDLFINATCYINLSPWLLQWVNTVWVQDSGDTGHAGTGSRFQQKITYRDNVYHNLYKVNQVQFPLKNIYNHDPIYGVSDGSSSNTEDFRDFLFANTVRGTAFWELYYSPSIMDDAKWQVNADALDFAETNAHILEKAKLFGSRATQGVYGYSAWEGNEGIVSFRNPTGEEKEFELQLTDVVGVPKSVKDLNGVQINPYVENEVGSVSYGDTIKVTLAPYETKILQYGKVDNEAAKIISAKVTGENEVTVKYDERIRNNTQAYQIEGTEVLSTQMLDDYRTVVIKTQDKLKDTATIKVNGERDNFDNESNITLTIPVYTDGNIIDIKSNEDLVNAEDVKLKYNGVLDLTLLELDKAYEVNTKNSFEGNTDFSITMAVNTESSNVNLLKQGEDIQVSIDEEGFVNFRVKDLEFNSKSDVTTVVEKAHGTFGTDQYVPTSTQSAVVGKVNDGQLHNITVAREVNGMLKIYIDGELMNSAYDQTKVNEIITAGKVEIADDNFNGILGGVELRNNSSYYDDIAAEYENYNKLPIIEYDRKDWSTNACSQMTAATGDGPATSAIDGNLNSWWHTNYNGSDNHDGKHWIEFDFGKDIEFDTVNVVSRGKNTNGTIKDYKLEAKIDGEWTVVKEGTFTDGKNDKIELDEPIVASEIKVTALSTFNGANFAAIIELDVTKKDRFATTEEMNVLASSVKEINVSDYTIATANRYNKVANKVKALDVITIGGLKTLETELTKAYESLVDAKDLNKLINDVKDLNSSDYSETTWKVFEAALENANNVVANIETTKEDVNEALVKLQKAVDELSKEDINIKVDKVNNLSLGQVTNNTVELTWDAPKSEVGLVEYIVYKDGKKIASIPATTTNFTAQELKANTIYSFKVTAKYANEKESKPRTISARTAK